MLDILGNTLNIFQSAGFQYVNKMFRGNGTNFWHPGYAWAMRRSTYEKTGGLLEYGIVGSGDHLMLCSWIEEDVLQHALDRGNTEGYVSAVRAYAARCLKCKIKIGYIPYTLKVSMSLVTYCCDISLTVTTWCCLLLL